MKPRIFRFCLRALLFLAIPWLLGELLLGNLALAPKFVASFAGPYERVPSRPLRYLFLGSSRVAAALPQAQLDAAFGPDTKNLGVGYASPATHDYGLKSWLRRQPDLLQGATVLIEAPDGMPPTFRWTDPWYEFNPMILIATLTPRDLHDYWELSPSDLKNKLLVSLSVTSRVFKNIPLIRYRILAAGDAAMSKALARWLPKAPDASLTAAGGIRVDREGIEMVRKSTLLGAEQEIRDQKRVPDWGQTVIASTVRLLQSAGAKVIFYTMPLSPTQGRPYQTELRKADERSFREHCKSWGARFVDVHFPCTDADFPDLMHMGTQKAPAFTSALARAVNPPSPPSPAAAPAPPAK
jgi:hypothetical protein